MAGGSTGRVVILGGGQAGWQTAESLRQGERQEGWTGSIELIGEETRLPYQRPPLSKAYLLGEIDLPRLMFRAPQWYADHDISVRTGVRATAIDRAARTVALDDGTYVAYDHLVLALGARPRPLPLAGADLPGVHHLKTIEHVTAIEAELAAVQDVAVIGAGFIGLEFAAVARKLGKRVTVLEAAPRVMARAVCPELSAFFADTHRSHGVDLRLGAGVAALIGGARVEAVQLADGSTIPAGLVVVGVGVLPEIELAAAAGLECDNGIVVDQYCRTSDPRIFAAGDCAAFRHPFADGALIRLESVQNAADQGRIVAAAIAGKPKAYDAPPWFWSDQYDLKLQMVGLRQGCDLTVARGDMASAKFSLFHFRDGVLRSVDSVNRAADHIQGRKLLAAGVSPTPTQAADPDFKLAGLLK